MEFRRSILPVVFSGWVIMAIGGCSTVNSVHFSDVSTSLEPGEMHKSISFRFDYSALNTANIADTAGRVDGDLGAIAALIAAGIALSTGDPRAPVIITSNLSGDIDWVAQLLTDCPTGKLTNVRSTMEGRDWYLYQQNFMIVRADCVLDSNEVMQSSRSPAG